MKELTNSFQTAVNTSVFELMNKQLEKLALLENIVVSLCADKMKDAPSWDRKNIEKDEQNAQKIIHETQDMLYALWTNTSYAEDFERTEDRYFSDELYGE